MSLWVKIEGLDDRLPLRDVSLDRVLGEPVRWRFTVHVLPEGPGSEQIQRLAQLFEAGPTGAQASADDQELGKAAIVVGADFRASEAIGTPEWVSASGGEQAGLREDHLILNAHASAPDEVPDSFVPRRRVHRARNLLVLAKKFDHVARLAHGVANHLQRIIFDDGENAHIVQDGMSDWDFLQYILQQYNLLEDNARRKPLTILGSVDDRGGTAGKWVVNWATPLAYADLSDIKARQIEFHSPAHHQRTVFGSYRGLRCPPFASGSYPVVLREFRRQLDLQEWQSWSCRDVPFFFGSQELFVWKVSDQLYATNNPRFPVGWITTVFTLPKHQSVAYSGHTSWPRPWLGVGIADESPTTGPWIRVRLPRFEKGYDLLYARLATPSAGSDGTKGLHVVPQKGTQVLLAWSGYFNQSIITVSNTREKATKLEAPALWLESLASYHLEEIDAKHIGPVSVHSELQMRIDQPLRVKADGTDVEMKGGIFRTGR